MKMKEVQAWLYKYGWTPTMITELNKERVALGYPPLWDE